MNRLFLLPAISTLVATGSSQAHGEDMWLACKFAHDRTVSTDKKTGEKTQDVSRDLPETTYHYVINSRRVLLKESDSKEYIVDADLDEKAPEIGTGTTSTYFIHIS